MTSDQLDDLRGRIEALKGYLNYDQKTEQLGDLEQQTFQPEFWTDAPRAEGVMKQVRVLKGWVGGFNNLQAQFDDLDTLFEFYQAGDVAEDEVDAEALNVRAILDDLELKKMLSNEEDQQIGRAHV